jgi:hypothetical protein
MRHRKLGKSDFETLNSVAKQELRVALSDLVNRCRPTLAQSHVHRSPRKGIDGTPVDLQTQAIRAGRTRKREPLRKLGQFSMPKPQTLRLKEDPPVRQGTNVGLLFDQRLSQEPPSYADVCLPELVTLATKSRNAVRNLFANLPQQWPFADKTLVAVFPSFRSDVEAFHAGTGKSMTDMIEPHKILSIDRGARITLQLKLGLEPN